MPPFMGSQALLSPTMEALSPLSKDDVATIINAALEVLRDAGVKVYSQRALEILERGGQKCYEKREWRGYSLGW